MMKYFKIAVLLVLSVFLFTGCSLLAFSDTPVTRSNQERLHTNTISFVTENQDLIAAVIQSLQDFPENIQFIRREDESNALFAWENAWTPVMEPITNNAICSLFAGSVDTISLGEAIVFDMDGMGNVTNSVYIGFYYSPSDIPLWIEAPDKYLHAPMLKKDSGWIADKSYCDSDYSMKYYQLYTEKIMDCYYYYELKL